MNSTDVHLVLQWASQSKSTMSVGRLASEYYNEFGAQGRAEFQAPPITYILFAHVLAWVKGKGCNHGNLFLSYLYPLFPLMSWTNHVMRM